MEAHVAIWVMTLATWAFLLFNSIRLGLPAKYRLVFFFIFSSIAFESAMPLIASWAGLGTQLYAAIYMLATTMNLALAAAVLVLIYATPRKLSWLRDWHLLIGPCVLVGITLSDGEEVWSFVRLVNVTSLIVTYLGISAIVQNRQIRTVDLGWNLKMVLLAVTVPYVFQSIVFMMYKLGFPLSYEAADLWLRCAGLAAWIILAAGMIEYSPPTPVVAENSESGQTNGDSGRERTVGNLSETREQLC